MFWKRLASGIVLVILAIILVGMGGVPLLFTVMLISLIGQHELYRALSIDHKSIAGIGYAATVIYYMLVLFEGRAYMTAMIVGALMVFMTAYVATFPEYKTEEITAAFFGVCYVSVMMSYLYLTRHLPDGKYLVWLIFLSSWGCDTLAYCTGMLFGRHKMVPKLSPKKTWEGAVGGVIGASLLGLLFGSVLSPHMAEIQRPAMVCAFACGVGALISMIGDLAASAIKRNHDIKDFGTIIPGHGGILDRFDSLLFTAPAIYYAIQLMNDFT
ncbi:MAG: phosphatidate cytidylyltransferase [Eubacteriales bacterium]|nr:phosphatidate cytidylyltransferase [Eubacteriales bacterium]